MSGSVRKSAPKRSSNGAPIDIERGRRVLADTEHLLRGAGRSHKLQGTRNVRLELLAVDYCIQHAVLQQKLGALESLGQFLADGLFDHSWTGESDERSGFGDIQ